VLAFASAVNVMPILPSNGILMQLLASASYLKRQTSGANYLLVICNARSHPSYKTA
jgi:hypothetical protein